MEKAKGREQIKVLTFKHTGKFSAVGNPPHWGFRVELRAPGAAEQLWGNPFPGFSLSKKVWKPCALRILAGPRNRSSCEGIARKTLA